MLIGIIETGRPPEALEAAHGDYPTMFRRLLGAVDPNLQFETFAAVDDVLPDDPRRADAWLITGSRHGVYDRLPWIDRLGAFVRSAFAAGVPLVGICFGHQMIADALGGKVVKSERGWGIGQHGYDIVEFLPWMSDVPKTVVMNAVHQDQVVKLPEGATVVAQSEFCPYAVLAYGERAFSIQAHPEFDNDFERELLQQRLRGVAPETLIKEALASLDRPPQSGLAAQWIVGFLHHTASGRGREADAPQAVSSS